MDAERKLKSAYRVIKQLRRQGVDRLLWAVEFYESRVLYAYLLSEGYLWDWRGGKWIN